MYVWVGVAVLVSVEVALGITVLVTAVDEGANVAVILTTVSVGTTVSGTGVGSITRIQLLKIIEVKATSINGMKMRILFLPICFSFIVQPQLQHNLKNARWQVIAIWLSICR